MKLFEVHGGGRRQERVSEKTWSGEFFLCVAGSLGHEQWNGKDKREGLFLSYLPDIVRGGAGGVGVRLLLAGCRIGRFMSIEPRNT